MSILKKFGVDFNSPGGAPTLSAKNVTDTDAERGTFSRTHRSGWTIAGEVHEDYFVWVNAFTATHPTYGKIEGDFEREVTAESEEAFAHFWANHEPEAWDYADI